MTWPSAVAVLGVAVLWLTGPGLVVGLAAGLRGVLAWGAAPLLSVGLVSGSALLGSTLGVHWGPAVPGVTALVLAACALAVRHLRGTLLHTGAGDGRWVPLGALAGSAGAAAIGLATAVAGMGRPDAVSQTFDASFHYNAVARILATGDASATTLGGLVNSPAPYPAGWHATVSLVAPHAGGTGIVTASNMTALAVALVVWPASQLMLVRLVAGRSAGAALATPLLAIGFGAFPWALVTYGALWPNLLGVALMPAALAAVVAASGLVQRGPLGRGGAVVLSVVALPAVAFGHPNAVFGLAVVAVWPMLWGAAASVVRRVRAARWLTAVALVAVTATACAATYWVMVLWPGLDGIRGYTWTPIETWSSGALNMLTSSPNGRAAAWTISALVVVGAVVSLRRARRSWLVPAWISTATLYVVAAVTASSPWTGVWYNDSPRLAAMVPVAAVPLAVVGTLAIAGVARRAVALVPLPSGRRSIGPRPAVVAAVALLALLVSSGGLYRGAHAENLAEFYQHPVDTLLVPGQEAFLEEVGDLIPPDAVVAQNPWTGNALLWTLADREVLFPHLTGVWTPEQRVIAERLRDAAADPSVCDAVRATDVGYALTGPLTMWSWDPLAHTFPGLDNLDGVPGFELLAQDGPTRLYRVTACEPDRVTES